MRKNGFAFSGIRYFFLFCEVFRFAMNANVGSSRKDVMRAFWLLTLPSIVQCTHPTSIVHTQLEHCQYQFSLKGTEMDIIQIRKREHFPHFEWFVGSYDSRREDNQFDKT